MFSAPRISYDRVNGKGTFWGLGGSASVKGRTVTLTAVNPHVTEPRETDIGVRGASISAARAVTIAAADIHAHNTYEGPDTVHPRPEPVNIRQGNVLTYRFPPASVTRLTLDLS